MRNIILKIVAFLFISSLAYGQQKYWIYFTGKPSSQKSDLPATDLPLSKVYIDSLKIHNISPIVQSKWLNALTAYLSIEQVNTLQSFSFISKIVPVDLSFRVCKNEFDITDETKYPIALKQVNGEYFGTQGLNGNGVKVGIIDGGFLGANSNHFLQHIIDNNRVIAYKNYIDPEEDNPYEGQKIHMDHHGTKVWEFIAGLDKKAGKQAGLAPEARFYLARTDQGEKEFRGEEDYWIAALEWMDSLGVRLVNSSVGYSTGYDNPKENYSPDIVDGKSTAITKAATIATEEKNMIIVISAGNDGNRKFKVLSLPADAKGLITVGAIGNNTPLKIGYSSIGPEGLGYLKPNLACYSLSGTSFSAPVITGMAACIMQACPEITPTEMTDILQKSCHLYPYGNNYVGYGIPNGEKIVQLLEDRHISINNSSTINANQESIKIPVENKSNVTIFHKKNEITVIKQQSIKPTESFIIVSKYKGASHSTVSLSNKVIEIIWP